MSESQSRISSTGRAGDGDDETSFQPEKPSKYPSTSSAHLLSEDITSDAQLQISSQTPVKPKRSFRTLFNQRSYSPVRLRELGETEGNEPRTAIENNTHNAPYQTGHLPPKAFKITQKFLWLNLGRWHNVARHFSIFSILSICIILPLYYSPKDFPTDYHYINENAFEAFSFDCAPTEGWSFVGIDLVAFPDLTFGVAKAIDLAWNWVVGRGLQAILTIIAYRVFSDALLRVVELSAVPFELYATLALPSGKIELLWQVCKNMFKRRSWRIVMIFIWLLVSTIYLITFPGYISRQLSLPFAVVILATQNSYTFWGRLMDAATAYEVPYDPQFTWPNGTQEAVSEIDWLSIPGRLDRWQDQAVHKSFVDIIPKCIYIEITDSSYTKKNISQAYIKLYPSLLSKGGKITNVTNMKKEYEEQSETMYRYYNNFSPCNDTAPPYTRDDGIQVYQAVDLAHFYYWHDTTLNTTWWEKYEKEPLRALYPGFWSKWDFYPTNQTKYQCTVGRQVLNKDNASVIILKYQWGFSFGWLFLIAVVNSAWLFGLWILWLDCDLNSEFCRKRRRLGVWRAIADISEAMREELGPNICAYSDEELVKALKKRVPVKYYATNGTTDEPAHLGLSTRKSGKLVVHWGTAYGRGNVD